MRFSSLRALPFLLILAMAGVLFWALVAVFGSENASDESAGPVVAAADDNLPRIPLEFPEVSKPLIEALPSPEPSPEVSPAGQATQTTRRRSTATTTRPVRIPTNGQAGSAVTGESGDATFGSPQQSGPASDDDIVGDLDDEFDDPIGPDDGADEEPEPEEPAPEPDVEEDEPNGTRSGDSGNNGANGANQSTTDSGETNEGDVD